mmetsp:Transcript_5909/g.14288  ORF Transcript_5909/g.14288 Transcript_5909/m.14288 type:complete len:222 (+) Transcript_5909:1050-1715(+)
MGFQFCCISVGIIDTSRQDQNVGLYDIRLDCPQWVETTMDGDNGLDILQSSRRKGIVNGTCATETISGHEDEVRIDCFVGHELIDARLDTAHEEFWVASVLCGKLDARGTVVDVGEFRSINVGNHGNISSLFGCHNGTFCLVSSWPVNTIPIGKNDQSRALFPGIHRRKGEVALEGKSIGIVGNGFHHDHAFFRVAHACAPHFRVEANVRGINQWNGILHV